MAEYPSDVSPHYYFRLRHLVYHHMADLGYPLA